jgi:hypothetical protein
MPASSIRRGTIIVAVLVAGICASAQADFTFRTVALTGTQAPDRPVGQLFGGFKTPRIDDHGHVAFEGSAGSGTSWSAGGWQETPERLRLSFVDRQPLPSLGSGHTLSLAHWMNTPFSGVDSETFFGGINTPGGGYTYAAFAVRNGTLEPVAREWQAIPGIPYVVGELNFSSMPVITPSGQAAFTARVGPTWHTGNLEILTNRSGTLACVAQNGFPVPGMDGWTFGVGVSEPVINDNGIVAFSKGIAGPGASASGIWVVDDGTPQMVVSSNTSVPGQPGVSLGSLSDPAINNAGQIAFSSWGTRSIWRESGGTLSVVARVGDHAPDTPDGVQFGEASYHLISGSGGVSFRGRLSGPGVNSANNQGVWSDSTGVLRLVVREGQQAPGMPDGFVFGGSSDEWMISGGMNALGQFAFVSGCRRPGVPPDRGGIWFTGLDGSLHYLIGSGDTLTVAPGDVRTITGVNIWGFSGGQDGRASFFNASGELAFLASFTDGSSGVFVAATPEPGAIAMSIAAWLLAARRRRR